MDKNNFKLFLYLIMIIDLILVFSSGFIREFRDFHETFAFILLFLIIVHLILNFSWIKTMVGNLFKSNSIE